MLATYLRTTRFQKALAAFLNTIVNIQPLISIKQFFNYLLINSL